MTSKWVGLDLNEIDQAFDEALDMGAQGVDYDDDKSLALDYLEGDDEDLEFMEDEDE